MIGYLIDYFTFKEFCLLTVIVYLIMCWYNTPTYARAVSYMQNYQEQLDSKNNVKYDINQHTYTDGGVAYFKCMANGAGWGRVIREQDKKYVLCSTFTGKDILKK